MGLVCCLKVSKRRYRLLFFLHHAVHRVSFNVYGTERASRAEIFASAATYTSFYVDYGYLYRFFVIGVGWYHENGSRRAVASTVATGNAISERYAVFLDPHGMSDACR